MSINHLIELTCISDHKDIELKSLKFTKTNNQIYSNSVHLFLI
jgi:hypothetical protein